MNRSSGFELSLVMALVTGSSWAQPSFGGALRSSNQDGAPAARVSDVLWFQNDQDAGFSQYNPSQNFEATFDAYDAQAADDFLVPEGEVWVVNQIQVTGTYYNGPGAARSENLVFYRNRHDEPGKTIATYENVVGTPDGPAGFLITLPSPLTLPSGKYWLSVQVNMDFQVGGEWAWESRATRNLKRAVWRDPGFGFGYCKNYKDLRHCSSKLAGPDLMFTVFGDRQLQ